METYFSSGFLKIAGLVLVAAAAVIGVFFFTNVGSYSLSGKTETETTSLEKFDMISFAGSGTIELKQGTKTQIEVTTDTGLIKKIQIEQKDGVVDISLATLDYLRSLKLQPALINYSVTSPEYIHIKTSGSFRIENKQEISGDEITIENKGKTELNLNLIANKLDIHNTGQTKGFLSGNALGTTTVTTSGDSNLNFESFGGKNISYTGSGRHKSSFGKPDILKIKVTGVGVLEYLETPKELDTEIQGKVTLRLKNTSETKKEE